MEVQRPVRRRVWASLLALASVVAAIVLWSMSHTVYPLPHGQGVAYHPGGVAAFVLALMAAGISLAAVATAGLRDSYYWRALAIGACVVLGAALVTGIVAAWGSVGLVY